jgi:uncharacterized membrane protein YkoI
MNTSRLLATAGLATSAAVLVGGLAAATTTPPEPTSAEPTTDLGRASEAALAETGDGTVVAYSVERNGYEVEVALPDGTVIEVRLDDEFVVTGTADESRDDDDDDMLTSAQIAALADVDLAGARDAALAAAGNDGVVVEVDYDEDDGGYDADVELADGTTFEVELADDLTVVATDTDD